MKKRKWRWLRLATLLTMFVVWLEPTRIVWGWLRGEAFYQGRPTSYWENVLRSWEVTTTKVQTFEVIWVRNVGSTVFPTWATEEVVTRRPGPLEETWTKWFGGAKHGRATPAILSGDGEAEFVLDELVNASSDRISRPCSVRLAAVRNA